MQNLFTTNCPHLALCEKRDILKILTHFMSNQQKCMNALQQVTARKVNVILLLISVTFYGIFFKFFNIVIKPEMQKISNHQEG